MFFQLVQCFVGASELSAQYVSVPMAARHFLWCISLLLAFFNMPLHCSFADKWKADNLIHRRLRCASCALLCRFVCKCIRGLQDQSSA
uniref:Putative secreted protein n=1 Tax=Amblyomma cajennense TaxID=34607 RepID=A0A023FD71_AMBCJ